MDMRFGTWNARSLHSAGSLITVATEISLGRLRRRWEDNIKMDLTETGWGGLD
jgi:hypothetical protein